MRAKCLANTGEKLSKVSVDAGYAPHTQYHLNVGDIYTVYGVNVWRYTINYLTMNAANSLPIWSPAELFQLVDYRIPPNWYFKYLITDPLILNSIWGYQELAMDPKHHDGIIGGDKAAVALFFERKKEIDRFHG
jgi:hypothetical protein